MGRINSDVPDSERLSALERDVSHQADEFSAFRVEVREGFSALRRLIESQKQPVTAFAGWAAVVLTLVAAVLWPQIQTDARLETGVVKLTEVFYEHIKDGHPMRVESKTMANSERLRELEEAFRKHELLEGHPAALVTMEWMKQNHDEAKDDLAAQDIVLQREIMLNRQAVEAKLEELDTVLQREMRFLDDISSERIKAVEHRLDVLERGKP